MKNKKEVVEILCESCDKIGVVETIRTVLGNNVKVSIKSSIFVPILRLLTKTLIS